MAELVSSRALQWASRVQDLADHARGLTSGAVQSVIRSRSLVNVDGDKLDALLDGTRETDKVDGMRRVMALSAAGQDMSGHFPAVVKNVASSNLQVRKLVYIYIARYAESQPDLALLSINTIQRALSDHNPVVRGMALRCMSSIRVPSIAGIVLLAIKRGLMDASFYVRKNAAIAIAKLHALDPTQLPQLQSALEQLLNDDSPPVLEAALYAWQRILPGSWHLIHPHYRRICGSLSRMSLQGQVDVLHLLAFYARLHLSRPSNEEVIPQAINVDQFYSEQDGPKTSAGIDRDLRLLHATARACLYSSTASVVIAATFVISTTGTPKDQQLLLLPLIALLRQPSEQLGAALTYITHLISQDPQTWRAHARHFLVYPTDPSQVVRLKLRALSLLVYADNASLILSEVAEYSRDRSDPQLSSAAIQTLGDIARRDATLAGRCMAILFDRVRSSHKSASDNAVVAIRRIVQSSPEQYAVEMKTLGRSIDTISSPEARASVFWLVAEFAHLLPRIAPDLLRKGVKGFAHEHEHVRLQILVLAVKLYILECLATGQSAEEAADVAADVERDANTETNGTATVYRPADSTSIITQLYKHVMHLARYDRSYDLRDRCRLYSYLASSPGWVLTRRIMFELGSASSSEQPDLHNAQSFNLGSTSMLLSRALSDYVDLPPWTDTPSGSEAREAGASSQRHTSAKNLSSSSTTNAATAKSTGSRYSRSQIVPTTRFLCDDDDDDDDDLSSNHTGTAHARTNQSTSGRVKTGISSLDDFYATSSSASDSASASSEEVSEDEVEDSISEDDDDDDDDDDTDASTGTSDESTDIEDEDQHAESHRLI
ncbi:AP-3 complex subunit beta [Savitreella phatthalungensis]